MNHLPEAYFFFKQQLQEAQQERAKLKRAYEAKIASMNEEIKHLKEQIEAQHLMIKNSVEYVLRLESQINTFKQDLDIAPAQAPKGQKRIVK